MIKKEKHTEPTEKKIKKINNHGYTQIYKSYFLFKNKKIGEMLE